MVLAGAGRLGGERITSAGVSAGGEVSIADVWGGLVNLEMKSYTSKCSKISCRNEAYNSNATKLLSTVVISEYFQIDCRNNEHWVPA